MRLTVQSDYALRTLVILASRPGDLVPASRVAASFGISGNHVSKVAKTLVRLGYVRARRGHAGGLELAMPAERIRPGDVIRQVEPDLAVLECLDPVTNTCPVRGVCALEHAVRDAREAFFEVLNRRSLAELVRDSPHLPLRLLRVVS